MSESTRDARRQIPKQLEGKEGRRRKVNKETREEVSRKKKRRGENGEDETVAVERRCTPLRLLIYSVRRRVWRVVGILGRTFWVTLVVCLIVGLRHRRVCLL